ncbi:Kelch repeat-containing protein [Gilvimarinus polysaccharolyticus]|uniref:Kelch repeat-containing protein n=1 Tax=Gilvimarinus polysaccharolyticus TaxID=863921 RepID=UPI000A06B65D|nr:kelch repeat-containing protein [Gilvimarinus polysaccharolyticus]
MKYFCFYLNSLCKFAKPLLLLSASLLLSAGVFAAGEPTNTWKVLDAQGTPTARHEAAAVAFEGKLYLLGGRRINPTDVYDPATNRWEEKAKPPIELHHFQAVVLGEKIYLIGAMTGGWPNETPLTKVMAYVPAEDRFETLHDIPAARQRGGAGVVVYKQKIYIVGGIKNGHMNGTVNWLDEYDPSTGQWRVLPDAPHKRDHFSAAVIGHKLYAFGGRQSNHALGNNFGPSQLFGDIFDFETGQWLATDASMALPTGRSGSMAMAWGDKLIVGGGESDTQVPAHANVEAFNTNDKTWSTWPSLNQGRHGSALVIIDDYAYLASGCGQRGGEPELNSIERLKLPASDAAFGKKINPEPNSASQPMQHHSLALSFNGPETEEGAALNPFTDYRLLVEFRSGNTRHLVRGFYAADGNAANTGATKGNVWQVRFSPESAGDWHYTASLKQGKNIAIERDPELGDSVAISPNKGTFTVLASNKKAPDFRAANAGLLQTQGGYFTFKQSGQRWLKGGTNSPENLLAYTDFDNTYRLNNKARSGEAAPDKAIHSYRSHQADWRPGDPTWGEGKGKAIIGAMNYLASEGVNAAYFLTLNLIGDGKDVWPYIQPDEFTRFDVSKLEQWNILFEHMQAKGLLLHIVTQETENELLLDGGDTGLHRSLYYSELIARFGHHPGLVWNLGEENGPIHWSPKGQTDAQRRAMAQFFNTHDPYQHPVFLHTHSGAKDKDDIVGPLLGLTELQGLSFQVADRTTVNSETRKWRALSETAQAPWAITMDEIGEWHTGAMPDSHAGNHNSLRRHALWGHLLGGGAGVEWYFGAHFPSNDLGVEDFRSRHNLWMQTRYAREFFQAYLPYWEMAPCNDSVIDRQDTYCFAQADKLYSLYLPEGRTGILKLPNEHRYELHWFDPQHGGGLQGGSVKLVQGSDWVELGLPPVSDGRDWVLMIKQVPDMP